MLLPPRQGTKYIPHARKVPCSHTPHATQRARKQAKSTPRNIHDLQRRMVCHIKTAGANLPLVKKSQMLYATASARGEAAPLPPSSPRPLTTLVTVAINSPQASTGVVGETITYATLPSTRAYTPDSSRLCTTSTARCEALLKCRDCSDRRARGREGGEGAKGGGGTGEIGKGCSLS